MDERRDFPKWKVELAYIAQDGVCTRCGNTLEHGFHRHHKDGNPLNNTLENLELLCPECHRATLGEAYKRHREQEERALNYLNKLLDECFNGRLSGATVERLVDAITLSLKISRSLSKLDTGIESPPPTIALLKKLQETRILQEYYLEGFKEGIKWLGEQRSEGEFSVKKIASTSP
jgi:hypothetical protein